LIENLRTIDACNYDRGRKAQSVLEAFNGVTVLLVRICESPIDFIPSTAICLEIRTGTTFFSKLRKCASMTLRGICTVSN